jgi:ribosomal protein L36
LFDFLQSKFFFFFKFLIFWLEIVRKNSLGKMVKVAGKLKPWCKHCYQKMKKGRMYNYCSIDPRHKHRTKESLLGRKEGLIRKFGSLAMPVGFEGENWGLEGEGRETLGGLVDADFFNEGRGVWYEDRRSLFEKCLDSVRRGMML